VDESAVAKTLQRMNEGLAGFFWDAFTAVAVNGVSAGYVEFGSWGGNTFRRANQTCEQFRAKRHLWAFDSFQALSPSDEPRDRHPGLGSGLGQGGVEVFHATFVGFGVPRDAYTAVEGYYQETLPPLGAEGEPRDITIAYVDCNLYSGTVIVFEFLAPRLKPGMIIGFDDYYLCNPRCRSVGRARGPQRVPRDAAVGQPLQAPTVALAIAGAVVLLGSLVRLTREPATAEPDQMQGGQACVSPQG
jgi:Macrocin-O-methyltransferase (TylF)